MTLFPMQSGSNLSVLSARGVSSRLKALTLVVLGLFAVLFISGTVASAQLETGQISGTVLDQTGAAVPGASVAIKNLGTNSVRNTVSSPTGAYRGLRAGTGHLPGHGHRRELQALQRDRRSDRRRACDR